MIDKATKLVACLISYNFIDLLIQQLSVIFIFVTQVPSMFLLTPRSQGSLYSGRGRTMSDADELDSVIRANAGPSVEGNLRLLDTM